jgi:hypothetical protein
MYQTFLKIIIFILFSIFIIFYKTNTKNTCIFIIILLIIICFNYLFCHKSTMDCYYNPTKINKLDKVNKIDKILVFQLGSYKVVPEFAELSKLINKKYCEKYGYDYVYIDHPIDYLPPYWLRVDDLHNYLNDNKYDLVVYLDLDAIFYDFSVSIEQLLSYIDPTNKYDIFIGKDLNVTIVNSGVFMFRNTEVGKQIASEWLDMCLNTKKELVDRCATWIYDNNKWSCPGCKWAGKNYEQGALEDLWKKYRKYFAVLKYEFISNMDINVNSFVLHLMASDDDYRTKIFDDFIKNNFTPSNSNSNLN